MSELPQNKPNPIRQTTPEAIRLAKTLIRCAQFGTIAVIDPSDGRPHASRIALATDAAGQPVTLISNLSFHTKCLLADLRCSLLVGEPGKGDALAHPRISIACRAQFIERGEPTERLIIDRFLRKNPKAKLYAGFADFNFVRLEIQSASLNGGFGQAFELSNSDLISAVVGDATFDESKVIAELNHEHLEAVREFLQNAVGRETPQFSIVGIDSEGIDFDCGANPYRIWFSNRIATKFDLFSHMLK